MKKYGLLSEIRRRRKWVQMGQQVHKYENLLNRQFHADRPNSKWVTDISYIHTGFPGAVQITGMSFICSHGIMFSSADVQRWRLAR